jgi:cystathionine beta-lyase/cystathionine gamma-synthase
MASLEEDSFVASDWSDECVLQNQDKGDAPIYCRSTSTQVSALSNELCSLHPRASGAFITASGMAAISAVIQTVLKLVAEDPHVTINLLYGSELYCDTLPALSYWVKMLGVKAKLIELPVHSSRECQAVFERVKKQTNIVFVESCSNPSQHLFDFSLLESLKSSSKKCFVIVDNTWLTHVIFNPFSIEQVDVVVMSLSKYYSGGMAIGGAILVSQQGDAKLLNEMQTTLKMMGSHVCPNVAQQILNAVSSIEKRIHTASASLRRILVELDKENILYCESDKALAKRYFASMKMDGVGEEVTVLPPIITFYMNKSKNATCKILKSAAGLRYATSFGGAESRLDNWPKRIDTPGPSGSSAAADASICQCRLSIGFVSSEQDRKAIVGFLLKNATKK